MNKNLTYAIDFGTSNSLLAAADSQKTYMPIALDPFSDNCSTLRSLIYFSEDLNVYFGQEAIQRFVEEDGSGRFLRSIKKYLPQKSFTGTRIGNRHHNLETLISEFLKEMKKRADHHFQSDITRLVLGRPASFSSDPTEDKLANDRLMKAAQLAGFIDIEFMPEPLAAAYDYKKQIQDEKIILVVDLGGGTSDFTVVKVHRGPFQSKDVLSIGGISVAGNALDSRIMSQIIAPNFGTEIKYKLPLSTSMKKMPSSLKYEICSPPDITFLGRSSIMPFLESVRKSPISKIDREKLDHLKSLVNYNLGFQIFENIEQTKVSLCNFKSIADFRFNEADISIHEKISFTEFEKITNAQIQAILKCMDEVIHQAGLRPQDIDSICCTGGTSKVPAIFDGLLQRFGSDRIQTFKSFHSIIQGLAEKAHQNLVQ